MNQNQEKLDIVQQVKKFNDVFGLPSPHPRQPSAVVYNSLAQFKKILDKEIREYEDVMSVAEELGERGATEEEILVPLLVGSADWLGDIVVYCLSEMFRMGLPPHEIITIIMNSQYSKLVDGKAIVIDGKVQKGPGYVAPEPEIEKLIRSII